MKVKLLITKPNEIYYHLTYSSIKHSTIVHYYNQTFSCNDTVMIIREVYIHASHNITWSKTEFVSSLYHIKEYFKSL